MNTPMKLAKTMNKCARVLRQRSSQLIASHGRAWSRSSMTTFKPQSNPKLGSSSKLAIKESSLPVEQRRFYNDRNDWRECNQRGYQSGMDATYEMPNMGQAQSRYDDIYLNREPAPIYEANVEHEGFDPRYDDYHFKRQPREAADQFDDGELTERRGAKPTYAQMGHQDGETRRRMSQDPAVHQMRQERIIEENKRKWQNRTEPKREVHMNGITYNIDKVYGAQKTTPRPTRVVRNKQTAEEYSRNSRAARENELRRLSLELRESRKGYNLQDFQSERSRTQMKRDNQEDEFDKPTAAWLNKQREEENEKYWHSWNSCPDERRVIEKSQQVAQGRRTRHFHPYDVTRRGLHHQPAVEAEEISEEYMNNLKAHAKVRVKTAEQIKSEYLLSLMQQEEDILKEQDRNNVDYDDDDDELERNPPIRRRIKPATTLSQPSIKAEATKECLKPVDKEEEEVKVPKMRLPMRRNHSLRVPIKAPGQIPEETKPRPRSIAPPRFQMSIKSKVTRNRPPVCSFSDTLISNMSTTKRNSSTQYRSTVRPSISSTWSDFTSSHFAKSFN